MNNTSRENRESAVEESHRYAHFFSFRAISHFAIKVFREDLKESFNGRYDALHHSGLTSKTIVLIERRTENVAALFLAFLYVDSERIDKLLEPWRGDHTRFLLLARHHIYESEQEDNRLI